MTPKDESIQIQIARLADANEDVRREASHALYEMCRDSGEEVRAAITALVECLGDPDKKVRESAEWALSYCGSSALMRLVGCLSSENRLVRLHAVRSIGNKHDEGIGAKDQLRKLLADEDSEIRENAARTLGIIGDKDERTLVGLRAMANSATASDRSAALHALGNLAPRIEDEAKLHGWLIHVTEAVQDEDDGVRWSAFFLLRAIKVAPAASLPLWTRGLDDPDAEVADMAVCGLIELGEETDISAAVPALSRLVERDDRSSKSACEALKAIGNNAKAAVTTLLGALKSKDPFLVTRAAEALWQIDRRAEESLPALANLLEEGEPGVVEGMCDVVHFLGPAAAPLTKPVLNVLANEDWDLKWAAADALGSIASPDPNVISALIVALGHKGGRVSPAAAHALAAIGQSAIPALVQVLVEEGDDDRRGWAADVLGHIGPKAKVALKPLAMLLRHENPELRAWCAIALGKIGRLKEIVPILIRILENRNPRGLRYQAAEALGSIGAGARRAIPTLKKLLRDEDEEIRAAVKAAIAKIQG